MDGLTLRAEDLGALTPEVLDRVVHGETVEITRSGAVVAKVVSSATMAAREVELAQRLRALRAEAARFGQALTLEQIRELRDDHSA